MPYSSSYSSRSISHGSLPALRTGTNAGAEPVRDRRGDDEPAGLDAEHTVDLGAAKCAAMRSIVERNASASASSGVMSLKIDARLREVRDVADAAPQARSAAIVTCACPSCAAAAGCWSPRGRPPLGRGGGAVVSARPPTRLAASVAVGSAHGLAAVGPAARARLHPPADVAVAGSRSLRHRAAARRRRSTSRRRTRRPMSSARPNSSSVVAPRTNEPITSSDEDRDAAR